MPSKAKSLPSSSMASSSKRVPMTDPQKPKLATKKAKRASSASTSASASASEALSTGREPLYFWREYDSEHGYLSQWYTSPFSDPSSPHIVFNCAEQYMMHGKALIFNDPESAAKILQNPNPKRQKALGQGVENFDQDIWNANKERIVAKGTYLKFMYGKAEGELPGDRQKRESLKDMLLGTGERDLVEASPYDKIWGIGYREKDAERTRKIWGLNLLGKCLVRVRERIRREEQEEEMRKVAARVEKDRVENENGRRVAPHLYTSKDPKNNLLDTSTKSLFHPAEGSEQSSMPSASDATKQHQPHQASTNLKPTVVEQMGQARKASVALDDSWVKVENDEVAEKA